MSEYKFGDVVVRPTDDESGNLMIGILIHWEASRDQGKLLYQFASFTSVLDVQGREIEPFEPGIDDPMAIQYLGTLAYRLGILRGKAEAAYRSAQASRRR